MTKQGRFPLLLGVVLVSAALLSACSLSGGKSSPSSAPQASSVPAAGDTQKSGVTTVSGNLTVTGKTAVLTTNGTTVPVESYSVKFDAFDGKDVTITGKFSGDTLFASEIVEAGATDAETELLPAPEASTEVSE